MLVGLPFSLHLFNFCLPDVFFIFFCHHSFKWLIDVFCSFICLYLFFIFFFSNNLDRSIEFIKTTNLYIIWTLVFGCFFLRDAFLVSPVLHIFRRKKKNYLKNSCTTVSKNRTEFVLNNISFRFISFVFIRPILNLFVVS